MISYFSKTQIEKRQEKIKKRTLNCCGWWPHHPWCHRGGPWSAPRCSGGGHRQPQIHRGWSHQPRSTSGVHHKGTMGVVRPPPDSATTPEHLEGSPQGTRRWCSHPWILLWLASHLQQFNVFILFFSFFEVLKG